MHILSGYCNLRNQGAIGTATVETPTTILTHSQRRKSCIRSVRIEDNAWRGSILSYHLLYVFYCYFGKCFSSKRITPQFNKIACFINICCWQKYIRLYMRSSYVCCVSQKTERGSTFKCSDKKRFIMKVALQLFFKQIRFLFVTRVRDKVILRRITLSENHLIEVFTVSLCLSVM